MRIVFLGTPAFAVPSLQALVRNNLTPVAVVTGPDRPRGRGRKVMPTAVKQAARELGIERILQPESVREPTLVRQLESLRCDVQVVVAFKILPCAVYATARLGAFNLHASLLPRYRGAAPIQRAVMAGEQITGVTTFFLRRQVDTGDMILQWPTRICPDESGGALHDRLARLGARAVVETVRRIQRGRVSVWAQDSALATPAAKIHRADCRVRWGDSASAVHNHCRALSPYPGAWTIWNGDTLKILRTRVAPGTGEPGRVIRTGHTVRVACGERAVDVLELQRAGQRRQVARDFLNGTAIKPGARLT